MSDRLVASAAAALAERDAALSQLRSLRELLVDGAPPPAAEGARWKDDWQRLTDTLCATLLAFRRSFKTEAEGARLVELMRTFRLESAAIYWPGADPARGDTAEARGYSMQALRSVLAELATRTGGGPNLLRKCTERRLSGAKWLPDGRVVSTPGEGVIDSLVVPLFATLEVALRRIAGGANGDGRGGRAPPCHQMRGRVWVLLGLLRWTLALPTSRSTRRKYELKETILPLGCAPASAAVAALDQAVANGGDVSEPIRAATAAEALCARRARDVARERVSARLPPPAPPFSQLHLEVHQWNRSSARRRRSSLFPTI